MAISSATKSGDVSGIASVAASIITVPDFLVAGYRYCSTDTALSKISVKSVLVNPIRIF
eukprot:SAG11_NODE_10511_length_825_cov_6.022039_1_plen_59_part_10